MDLFCAACFFPQFLRTFVDAMAGALTLGIFARVILSWVALPIPLGFQRWLFEITEPVLAPIRRALPPMGLDLSPLIAIILIGIVQRVLLNLLLRWTLG